MSVQASATIGTDGRYTFANVRAGTGGFIVRAALPSSANDPTTVDVAGDFSTAGETKTINVTMPIASMTLSGTIFTADGTTPIPNVYVQILNAAGTALTSFRTNASGAYGPAISLGNPPGVTIRAYDPSVVVSASQVQLAAPQGGRLR